MNEANKFVWAYLLENGKETTGKWCYYFADWESPSGRKWDRDAFLRKVKTIGVDWDRTKEPVSNTESVYEGTFHDSTSCEALLGTLFLRDGSSYIIGCVDEDNMGSYINNLMTLMKDRERVNNIFGE